MSYFEDLDADVFDPEDGPYEVTITDALAWPAKTDGREYCKLTLRVDAGPNAGREFEHFMSLTNPDARRISGAALKLYGVDLAQVDDIEDLAAQVGELVGAQAEVGVAHKNGYLRITVYSATPPGGEAGPPTDTPPPAAPTTADDDDIPF